MPEKKKFKGLTQVLSNFHINFKNNNSISQGTSVLAKSKDIISCPLKHFFFFTYNNIMYYCFKKLDEYGLECALKVQ